MDGIEKNRTRTSSDISYNSNKSNGSERLSPIIFGHEEWNRYFGAVDALPLPKKILDNYDIILIPSTVDGDFYTFNKIKKIIKERINEQSSCEGRTPIEVGSRFLSSVSFRFEDGTMGNTYYEKPYWCWFSKDKLRTRYPHPPPSLVEITTLYMAQIRSEGVVMSCREMWCDDVVKGSFQKEERVCVQIEDNHISIDSSASFHRPLSAHHIIRTF
ncbi:MAG: hypothetical protein V4489_03720 [Chlamydiota bacterium]